MPTQTIIKLKIRRGTDSQRKSVVLEQGELGYTTDTSRVFVGDGTTAGGRPVGSVFHTPVASIFGRTTVSRAVQNDIVVERSLMYQLTGTDFSQINQWLNISPKLDGVILRYETGTNRIIITPGTITADKLAQSIVAPNGGLTFNTGIAVNVDDVTISSSNNRLGVKKITENNINSTALGKSLIGGDGTKLNVNFDPLYFGYNISNQFTLTALPPVTVKINSIDPEIVGRGLVITQGGQPGGVLRTNVSDVDYTSIDLDTLTGVISLPQKHAGAATSSFENISYNSKGIITGRTSMFSYLLSGDNVGDGSQYNGILNQDRFTNQQVFTASYTDITTAGLTESIGMSLSSAGFIVVNTAAGGDVAIPIFRFSEIVNLTGGPIS